VKVSPSNRKREKREERERDGGREGGREREREIDFQKFHVNEEMRHE